MSGSDCDYPRCAQSSPVTTVQLLIGANVRRADRHAGAPLVSSPERGVGLAIAVASAVPLGLQLRLNRRRELSTSPVSRCIAMISPLSWMPIAMMVLGVGDQPVFFLSAVAAALAPIPLTLLTAVHHFDPQDIKVARSMAAEPQGHFSRIGLPTIRPNHLACVRVSVDLIWVLLV